MSALNLLKRVSSRSPSRDRGDKTQGSKRDSSPMPSPTKDSSRQSSRRSSFSSLLSPGGRAQSPFPVGPLRKDFSDIPLKMGPGGLRDGNASDSTSSSTTDDESAPSGAEDDEDDDGLDDWGDETNENTELNALSPPLEADNPLDERDPLGDGINVLYPKPEPHFSRPSHRRGAPRRMNSISAQGRLPLTTGRPAFQRDCCTITLTHGEPAKAAAERKPKTYLVCSDLSPESKFALDWAIGMVLRDGDELVVATVMETDSKLDPTDGHTDHVAKLRNQQERETHAYLLTRQVIPMLQRTKLHVTVICQSWHAKNMRHHILDLVDIIDPVMLIVGSRGMGEIKGILLGSTSHYLVQKSSVPVMVARRRLKRPARQTAHLEHRARVPLSQAKVEKEANVTTAVTGNDVVEGGSAADAEGDDGDDDAEEAQEERGRKTVRMAA
ncbi:adenine nucleotide alpha hydrolases-like protein [Auricularia subglabra TFB-10046 SS5]|nr:adenine nucleotide alpha hydrolases-like protein [Auricularia subglabra TFB-10046 SS5]